MIIRLLSFREGKLLDHAIDVLELGESNGFLGVESLPGWPACDGEALGHDEDAGYDDVALDCRDR